MSIRYLLGQTMSMHQHGCRFLSLARTKFLVKPVSLHSLYIESLNTEVNNNLVVMHGLFGSHTNFRSIVKNPAINNYTNSYLLDMRNHGESDHRPTMYLKEMGEDIVNFLEENYLSNVILMGHSMGGRAIMSALQHYSSSLESRVKGVIIVDISPANLIANRTADVFEMWTTINNLLTINLQGKKKSEIEQCIKRIIKDPKTASFMLMNIVPNEKQVGQYKWRLNLQAIKDSYKENVETEITNAHFKKPCFIIGGARSHFVSSSKINEFATIFPNMQYERDVHFIKEAGHWLHAEKPAEFTQQISQFLLRIDN